MSPLTLELEELTEKIAPHPKPRKPAPLPQLTFPEVDRGYLPGRALFLSAVAHELVIVAIFLVVFTVSRTRLPKHFEVSQMIDFRDSKGIVYLPVLGGGEEGNGHAGGSPGPVHKAPSSPAPSRSSKGVAFPGPQPILSSPPNPTNQNQTVLHPSPEKPKVLKQFVPLPNIVKMGKSALPLPKDLLAQRADMPELNVPPAPKVIEQPKLELPETAKAPEPIRPAVEAKRAAEPKTVQAPRVKTLPTNGADLETIVSLSPTPTTLEPTLKLPDGEARGRFAVSPEANVTTEKAPGSTATGADTTVAIGHQAEAPSGNLVSEVRTGSGTGLGGLTISGGGGGVGTGVGPDTGSGKGGTGTASARGSGTGVGVGTGPGTTSASGSGAGSGSGKGSLPGLTIQGTSGAYGNGAAVVKSHIDGIKMPSQTAYGMTVVSLASSGGGLPDVGVFTDEKVYTVYVDMRATPEDPAPSYTLQYALLQPPSGGDSASAQAGFTPPYPVKKEIPEMNAELIRRYIRRLVIVYATMGTDGKLQKLTVRESPDVRFNRPILVALNHWSFRPAQLNGQPVALKVLIGIPILPFE